MQRIFGLAFFIFFFAVLCFFPLITVQIGIRYFLFLIFGISFLYSFLIKWNTKVFDRYFILFVIFGIAIKILFAFSKPLWEDDWARFLWEGNLISIGFSPYANPPEFYFNSLSVNDSSMAGEILSKINHPDWTTIYFPLIELYFYLCAKVFPYSLEVLKLGYLGFDLLTLLIIRSLKNNKTAILYFLFPILIKETYLNAHFEIISIFLITLSIWAMEKKRVDYACFALGLAIHSKIFIIVLLPFFIFKILKQKSKNRDLLFSFLGLLLGFLVPFFILNSIVSNNGNFGIDKIFLFAKQFEFNSLLFHFIKLGTNTAQANAISICLFFVFLLYSSLNFKKFYLTTKVGCVWMFFCFLAYLQLSPVANPWYFLILVPFYFLSFPKLKSLWIIIAIPQCAYLTFTNLGIEMKNTNEFGFYNLPEPVILFEFISITLLQIYYFKKIKRKINFTD